MRNDRRLQIGYLLSFALPFFISFCGYLILGIYPGGPRMPLALDLRSEHFAYFNYLNTIGEGANSLTFQSMGGLGGGTIGSFEMYCGPFFMLSGLFPTKYVPYAIQFLIIIMAGLSGLSEFYYLNTGFPAVKSIYISLLLSCCYALSGCAVVFFIVPVWMIGIALLPMAVKGVDDLLNGKNSFLLVNILAISIVLNYYTSYMIFYFLVLYMIYRSATLIIKLKIFFRKLINLGFCFLLSILFSAFSWIPAFLELLNGKGLEQRIPKLGIVRNPFKILTMVLPFQYSGLNRYDYPFIFCGTATLLLVLLYFFSSSVEIKEKIMSFLLVLYLMVSFSVGAFDISWMFFSEPNGYPSRYSFVFSFVLILIAARSLDGISILKVKPHHIILYKSIIFFLVIAELLSNTTYVLQCISNDVGGFAEYAEYKKIANVIEGIKDEYLLNCDFNRTVKNWRYASNDGILFGYSDIDYFSSSYNSTFHEFMGDLGMNEKYHMLRSEGITPPVASVLGVSHFIQYRSTLYEYIPIGSYDELDIYENLNSVSYAFSVSGFDNDLLEKFGDNPFENINILIRDFTGVDDVYEVLPVNLEMDEIRVFAPEQKSLWLYVCSAENTNTDVHNTGDGSKMIYYDGLPVCEYANDISPYCVELGVGGGENVSFTYDGVIDRVYAAAYDRENAQKAYNILKQSEGDGFVKTFNGFAFRINNDYDSNVIITYPYEKGYEIYVDGKKTEYFSYRNALIYLMVGEGEHIISVQYVPCGLYLGCLITVLSIIIVIIIYIIAKCRTQKLSLLGKS